MTILEQFRQSKVNGKKWVVVTSYDYWRAKILSTTSVDAILVGDCSAMVMHGHKNTLTCSLVCLLAHTRTVRAGAPEKFIITTFPFLSVKKGLRYAIDTAEHIIQTGANAIKIDGVKGHEDVVRHLIEAGIPVIGHVGLKPTQYLQVGGFKVQGKSDNSQTQILEESEILFLCLSPARDGHKEFHPSLLDSNILIDGSQRGGGHRNAFHALTHNDELKKKLQLAIFCYLCPFKTSAWSDLPVSKQNLYLKYSQPIIERILEDCQPRFIILSGRDTVDI